MIIIPCLVLVVQSHMGRLSPWTGSRGMKFMTSHLGYGCPFDCTCHWKCTALCYQLVHVCHSYSIMWLDWWLESISLAASGTEMCYLFLIPSRELFPAHLKIGTKIVKKKAHFIGMESKNHHYISQLAEPPPPQLACRMRYACWSKIVLSCKSF